MKLSLEGPVFYSKDSIYVANVKDSDFTIVTDPVDISKPAQVLAPAAEKIEVSRDVLVNTIQPQIVSWFTTAITADKLRKNLRFEFAPFDYTPESRWVSVRSCVVGCFPRCHRRVRDNLTVVRGNCCRSAFRKATRNCFVRMDWRTFPRRST